MELIKCKASIKSKVASGLNLLVGFFNWQLEINNRSSYLAVYSPGIINKLQARAAIRKGGFKAIRVENNFSIY